MAHASNVWSPHPAAANKLNVYLLRIGRLGSCHGVCRSQQRMCHPGTSGQLGRSIRVKVCLMKMFPHTFAPVWAVREPVQNQKTQTIRPQHCSSGDVPVNLDIERLVSVMLSASTCPKDAQQCRRELIEKLPAETIDWNTVNWVALWPFATRRH